VRSSIYVPAALLFTRTSHTQIYTLSLHDALPILRAVVGVQRMRADNADFRVPIQMTHHLADSIADDFGIRVKQKQVMSAGFGKPDRKSTRLNSSHVKISYAVFCLKKKNNRKQ